MRHSDSMAHIAAALSKAQPEFPEIPKTKEGKVEGQGKGGNSYSFSYKYADLGDVIPKVGPVLERHGLSFSQLPDVNERGEDGLTTLLMHESGEWISGFMRLYLAKTTSQGHGSAITYARRYALCAALGIVADEDDDGQVASHEQRAPRNSGNSGNSGNQQSRSRRKPTDGTGDVSLDERIKSLSEDQQKIIGARINDNNFPDPLPPAAVRVVGKWVDELEQGKPF